MVNTRASSFFKQGPKNRKQLLELLYDANQRNVPNAHALKLLEGVLQISDVYVRDIMVPHAKITVISEKDLLKYNPLAHHSSFNIRDILRPVVFIPESKRLDSLLEDFQYKHYHMAIVVDEYGTVSGLVTIEDVLVRRNCW